MQALYSTVLRKSQSRSMTEYAPIAKALSTFSSDAEEKLVKKFEIAYLICKEGMAFLKMGPFCQLEENNGVELGSGYSHKAQHVRLTAIQPQSPTSLTDGHTATKSNMSD